MEGLAKLRRVVILVLPFIAAKGSRPISVRAEAGGPRQELPVAAHSQSLPPGPGVHIGMAALPRGFLQSPTPSKVKLIWSGPSTPSPP